MICMFVYPQYTESMAGLYIIATPIGHLGDITRRAVETLSGVHTIACEDTRHSRRLLTHLGISRPLLSCRGQNTARVLPQILALLGAGEDVAYISDAGTPGVSDPGSALVRGVRAAGFDIIPIPGASAVTALLSVSGVAGRGWFFEGFLPPKGAKRLTRLKELVSRGDPFLLYESPHRIAKLFDELCQAAPGHRLLVGRELTKIHEQIVEIPVENGPEQVENGSIPTRGEFAVLVWTGKRR